MDFKSLVSGYYGIRSLDEYDLKTSLLQDAENYIRNFVERHPIENYDYRKEAKKIDDWGSLKMKLQDSLFLLRRIGTPRNVS